MSRLELSIAWRYLRSRRDSRLISLNALIAIGGVTVAVSALIVILGVMNGLQTDLREKILIGSPDIRVMNYTRDLIMDDWRPVMERVKYQDGVVAVSPFVDTRAVVHALKQKYFEPATIEGIPPEGPGVPNVTTIRSHATVGDFTFATPDGARHGAVLGARLAERLNVVPGVDSIQIVTLSSTISPATGLPVPVSQTFAVTGVFETGMYEYDNAYVFTSLADAQRLANLGDAITGLEVKTPTRDGAIKTARRLTDSLDASLRVVDWQQQNSQLFKALALEKLGMSVILLLIVLVAAFNIVNTLIMVVTDRTREIGILRAMGMPAKSIRRVFLAQGLLIGAMGTGSGLGLGLIVAILIGAKRLVPLDPSVYFIDHLPVATQPVDVAIIAAVGLTVAAVSTIYPSRRAARLFPVEAIRHE